MEDIFEILIKNAMNERLDNFAKEDEQYRELDHELEEAHKQYVKLEVSEEQKAVINQMSETSVALFSRYAMLAYELAVKDTVNLLKEMGVVGRGGVISSNEASKIVYTALEGMKS